MNNTFPPFHPGQKVVCVDPVGRLVKGRVYNCAGCTKCDKCGLWHMNIEEFPEPDKANLSECSKCDNKKMHTPYLYALCRASRFAPIVSDMQAITFEKVIEQELTSVN